MKFWKSSQTQSREKKMEISSTYLGPIHILNLYHALNPASNGNIFCFLNNSIRKANNIVSICMDPSDRSVGVRDFLRLVWEMLFRLAVGELVDDCAICVCPLHGRGG